MTVQEAIGSERALTMPSLGADMERGILVEWRIAPGDRVKKGDIVAVIETEKSDIEIESWVEGRVRELTVRPGDEVPVGEPIALLDAEPTSQPSPAAEAPEPEAPPEPSGVEQAVEPEAPSEQAAEPEHEPEAATPIPSAAEPEHEPEATSPAPAPSIPRSIEGGGLASPAARRRAAELGIDLEDLAGTGPDGAVLLRDLDGAESPSPEPAPAERPPHVHAVARRMAEDLGLDVGEIPATGAGGAVTKADVQAAAEAHPKAPGPAPRLANDPAARAVAVRRAMATTMARSNREIPHYYLRRDVDCRKALEHLEALNAERGVEKRLLPAVLFYKAASLAMKKVPELNGYFRDGDFEPAEGINAGLAVSLRGGGIVVPTVSDGDRLDLDRWMQTLTGLVQRARSFSLRSSDVVPASFTITHLGDLGVDEVFGVIFPPQVALVGFGTLAERPWAENGLLGVRPVVTVTLAADHRAGDGRQGGRYLRALDRLLQEPEKL